MEYPVSRVVVQSLCDELTEIVPYMNRVIDSLERHGGLYAPRLAEVVPEDVVDEIGGWLHDHIQESRMKSASDAIPEAGPDASLELLERLFPRYVDELAR